MRYGNVAVKYTTWEEDEGTSVSEQRGSEHTALAGGTAPTPRLGEMGSSRGWVRLPHQPPCCHLR